MHKRQDDGILVFITIIALETSQHLNQELFSTIIFTGCLSNDDCPEEKECDEMQHQCTPLTCKNTTGKIGGTIEPKESYKYSKWVIGDVAEFCCEDGNYSFYSRKVHICLTTK